MPSKYVLATHSTKQILFYSSKKRKGDSISKDTEKHTNQQIQQKELTHQDRSREHRDHKSIRVGESITNWILSPRSFDEILASKNI